MDNIIYLLNLSIRLTAPVLLIALGGIFAIKVNVFNLALDGFSLFGCFAAVVGAYYTNSVFGGIVTAVLACLILSAIYSLFVLELAVDPIICAIAFVTICTGLTRYLLIPIFGSSGRFILSSDLALETIHIDLLDKLPVIGPILNDHSVLVYIALLAPFLIYIFFYKCKIGLEMRAVGLNEETAISAGINVKKIRYLALALNGIFCGLAGAQLALSLNMFNVGMTDGRGYIALAVLIMTDCQPILVLFASLLFGFSDAIVLLLSDEGFPPQFLQMLPYVLALAVAILPLIYKTEMRKIKQKRAERTIMQFDK